MAALEEEFGVRFKEEDMMEMQSLKLIKLMLFKYLEKV
jgi:acyl carrier protein